MGEGEICDLGGLVAAFAPTFMHRNYCQLFYPPTNNSPNHKPLLTAHLHRNLNQRPVIGTREIQGYVPTLLMKRKAKGQIAEGQLQSTVDIIIFRYELNARSGQELRAFGTPHSPA